MPLSLPHLIGGLPKSVRPFETEESNGLGVFLRVPRAALRKGEVGGLSLPKLRRYLVLDRPPFYWSRPRAGKTDLSRIQQGQFLLWERTDGRIGLLLPLIDGDIRAFLRGSAKGLSLVMEGALPGEEPRSAIMLLAAEGIDPYELIERSLAAVSRQLGTFRLRGQKRTPDFIDHLGWCTWDAFYTNVDEKKVLQGLESFKKGGVQPGFVILDDGWLDTTDQQLNDFPPDQRKFPRGLKPLIDKTKKDYGVRTFGIWHTFQGYWAGVHPNGPLGKRYHTFPNEGVIRPWDGKVVPLSMIDPRDIHRFYEDFHSYLRQQGVDLVKVDGQSALELFSHGKLGRVSTMRIWQRALQGSAAVHFNNNLLHCMSNSSDVAYNMLASVAWRNSDDFFPNKPESHSRHMHENAMNALWSNHFGLPDWDMFWSSHPEGPYHAAARAISGGTVYVSDKPGQQDFDLLHKLVWDDGRVLRCERPALPSRESIFVDPMREPHLLKITNRTPAAGVIGIFHCQHEGDRISDSFSPAEVHDLEGDLFAVWLHNERTLALLKRNARKEITLPRLGFEIATLSRVHDGWIAPLGLIEKFNGAASMRAGLRTDGSFCTELRGGGRVGFFCKSRPKAVTINERRARFDYDAAHRLLVVSHRRCERIEVVVRR